MKKDKQLNYEVNEPSNKWKDSLGFLLILLIFSILELYGILWFPEKFPNWIETIYKIIIPILFLVICFGWFVSSFIVNYMNGLEDETSVEEEIESTFSNK
ncbi:MAG: hypothetical protein ACP5NZ_01695 [Nanobdellota archaeon]